MNDKPRLLCLMQLPPPIHGASVVNERISESAWLASKFSFEVVALRFASSIRDLGTVSFRKFFRAATTGARLVRSLAVRRPDAVYLTITPTGGGFYRDCAYIAVIKAFRVHRIYHLHGKGISAQLDVPWRRAVYAWAFRDASVIHLSPLLASDIDEVVTAGRMRFVANGVPDTSENRVDLRVQVPPRILYLSTMSREKGPLVLLEALAQLERSGVQFHATFAGSDVGDGCVADFVAGVAKHSLGDRVRYVGPVFGAAKQALFESHDIFTLPTLNDAFPLVVLEAMQSRLPVVASLEGAIPDMVEEDGNGFLVPKGDPDALASRLAQLLDDAPLRLRMGGQGRARYEERFTIEHFERNLSDVLDQIVEADHG